MSDNIDDFFRKKLDDFGEPDDGWDQPSVDVWATAQTQLSSSKSMKSNKSFIALAILLSLGLLSSIAYIVHLRQHITTLKTTNQAVEEHLNQKNQDFSILQTACTKTQEISNKQAIQAIVDSLLIENLKFTLATDKRIIKQQQKKIQQSYKQQQQLQEKLWALKVKNIAQSIALKDTLLFAQKKPNTLNTLALTALKKLPQSLINHQDSLQFVHLEKPQPLPAPITWKKFEIGTSSSILTYIIPINNDIENINNIHSENQDEKEYSEVSGIYFAYAPKPNLYFRTGIQASYFNFERSSIAGLIYDKSSEYTNTESNLANDFSLRSSTPFNEIKQEITVEIPQGTTLETGDLLIMTLTNYQNFKFLQVPLGMAYYRGNNKWQWEFQSGLLFNRLAIGNYQIQAAFQANNIEIPIGDINIIDETTIVKHFISGYLGVGGNYQVTPNWQFRLGVRLEDNTFDIRSSNFLRFQNFNMGLNINANYRF